MSYIPLPTRIYTPTQHYPPHRDTDALASYPLCLHPRATIKLYRTREPQPLEAPCRQCAKPVPITLTQQKLFLTIERLLQTPATKLEDRERNEVNNWAVNHEVGVETPFVENGGGGGGGGTGRGRAWPFVDEFELDVAMKLLRKVGEGLNEKSLDMYLLMLKSLDGVPEVSVPVAPLTGFGTPRKPKSYRRGRYVPPPESSPLKSPVSSILVNEPPLRSFNTMKDLFGLFDRIEGGSHAEARLVEAYADVVVNEACTDCWIEHNVIDIGEGTEDSVGFMSPALLPALGDGRGSMGLGTPVKSLRGDRPASRSLHAIPPPRRYSQTRYALPTPQTPRTPFLEVGSNIRSVNPGKRAREEDGEEDELEERWGERAKKKRAARGGPSTPKRQKGERSNQPGGPKIRESGQSVRSGTERSNGGGNHARGCQNGKTSGFDEEANTMIKRRGAKATSPTGREKIKEMWEMINNSMMKRVRDKENAAPKQSIKEENSTKVNKFISSGKRLAGLRNPGGPVKEQGRTTSYGASIGRPRKPSESKKWSVEEIDGKEVIVID